MDFALTHHPFVLCAAFLAASALYASVGHGGASAYLALMGVFGMLPEQMKPIALVLNIMVSALALVLFARAGHFRGGIFWPLALASVPAAFVGGSLDAPNPVFKLLLGLSLVAGAWRLASGQCSPGDDARNPHPVVLSGLGLLLGFVSGLIGIGGGVFLTPLLILFRWVPAKPAAAVSAAFILANSLSGLGGILIKGGALPPLVWLLLPAVVAGGCLGAAWGSGRAPSPALRRALAAVLVIAAAKFLVT